MGMRLRAAGRAALLATAMWVVAAPAATATRLAVVVDDAAVVEARQALARRDRAQLAAARAVFADSGHALTPWVDYWELSHRLVDARQPELDAFWARWPGTYVEDRLRNDWLLELGQRRDWANFAAEFPRFRMNDDREVTCYWLLTRHLAGDDVAAAARAAWNAQRDVDDGCALLASTLAAAGVLAADDVWRKAQLAIEARRPGAARAAVALLGAPQAAAMAALLDQPLRWLVRGDTRALRADDAAALATLALMRVAADDPDVAATQLKDGWSRRLPPARAAAAWAHVARHAALRQQPQALGHAQQAWLRLRDAGTDAAPDWGDDVLAWHVRAALRAPADDARWTLVLRAIDAMSPATRVDAAWVYWRARAVLATAPRGAAGDAARGEARAALQSLTPPGGGFDFYAQLAAEDLGRTVGLPAAPAPLSAAERAAARERPGFVRALKLVSLGLRSEGVREWNFTLRGLDDRELLAAADLACSHAVWDRCINTSERTRTAVDVEQRYPLPLRDRVGASAREVGLDAALLYGLIRQESRFIVDARSGVGASGLMQLMPATARWTARQVGIDYRGDMIDDPDVNLLLGAAYLKRLVDDFDGALPLAVAGYNAGPGRPRRWREGPVLEAAAWAESIPFTETRDYVKKVLANATAYALRLGDGATSLKARLGERIAPRDPRRGAADAALP